MRIREVIEYFQAIEKTLGDVWVEGNREIKLTSDDILFLGRDDNVLLDYGVGVDWSNDIENRVCSIRIHQED